MTYMWVIHIVKRPNGRPYPTMRDRVINEQATHQPERNQAHHLKLYENEETLKPKAPRTPTPKSLCLSCVFPVRKSKLVSISYRRNNSREHVP